MALIGYDYVGMKPTMNVKEGDIVAKGQPVFEDKKRVGVIYTAPAAGVQDFLLFKADDGLAQSNMAFGTIVIDTGW